jgi:hypothetical protein
MEFIQKKWINMIKCRKKNKIHSNKIQVQISLCLKWNNLFSNANNYMCSENKKKICIISLKESLFIRMFHITQNNSTIILINYRQCDFTIS